MADNPHFYGHRRRLRERFLQSGLEGFADYEVVELVLTLAIPRADVKAPAKALLARFKDFRGILDAAPQEVSKVAGIGEVTPVALQVIKAAAALYLGQDGVKQQGRLTQRMLQERLTEVGNYWRMKIGSDAIESFGVTYLDSALRALGEKTHWQGTINRAAVYPREVIEEALRRKASHLVLAHNHPNGLLQASEEDKRITRQIVLAGETVDIQVLEHFIVSAEGVFRFSENFLL